MNTDMLEACSEPLVTNKGLKQSLTGGRMSLGSVFCPFSASSTIRWTAPSSTSPPSVMGELPKPQAQTNPFSCLYQTLPHRENNKINKIWPKRKKRLGVCMCGKSWNQEPKEMFVCPCSEQHYLEQATFVVKTKQNTHTTESTGVHCI